MFLPDCYAPVKRIAPCTPLGTVSRVNADGLLEYDYADGVRLASDSCPMVAGSYLMTVRALRQLYREGTPMGAEAEVRLHNSADRIRRILIGHAGDRRLVWLAPWSAEPPAQGAA